LSFNDKESEMGIMMKSKILALENIGELRNMLENINDFNFDIFEFDNITNKNPLYLLSCEIFGKYEMFNIIDEKKFNNFIEKIKDGYPRSVPYHNDLHATDVLQTSIAIVENGNFIKVTKIISYLIKYIFPYFNFAKNFKFNTIDLFSLFLAAICHDFKHPGLNNNYQINFRTDIAINYNGS
jgi:hypothetical protein